MRKTARKFTGFTLIELMVAMSVIAVLSTIAFTSYSNAQKSARDARRKADLNQINLYLQYYYSDNGQYPQAGNCNGGVGFQPGYGPCIVNSTAGTTWIPALSTYASRLPIDPLNTGSPPQSAGNFSYAYGNVSADGQHYDLYTQLENTQDADRCELKHWMSLTGITGPTDWCPSGTTVKYIYEASPDR